jgi:Fe-S oxidoreductase
VLTEDEGDVVFHAGCRICFDEKLWGIGRKAVTLMQNAGLDVGIMGEDEMCCGCKAYDIGYRGEFVKFAESNLDAWRNAKVKTVVTACSDGYHAFKHLYPDVGSQIEVLHMVELMERLIKEGRITFSNNIPLKVTYHDPCHLGRREDEYVPGKAIMGLYEEPRNVLRQIPGLELVEMYRIKEYAWCCGAGGGVREAYPDFSQWTALQRIEEAMTTGAEAIVSACPWCEGNFRDAIQEKKVNMTVYNIVELIHEAMLGGE